MKYRFKPDSRAQRVVIANGHISRTFERDKEPFEVTPQEARLLHGVEELEEAPAEAPKAATKAGRKVAPAKVEEAVAQETAEAEGPAQ